MMTDYDLYINALIAVRGVGPHTAKLLVNEAGDAKSVFSMSRAEMNAIAGIGDKTYEYITTQKNEVIEEAKREQDYMNKHAIRQINYIDAAFPLRFNAMLDGPLAIFVKGEGSLQPQKSLSVVGTRKATDEGKQICTEIVGALARRFPDLTIVSGLAYGIDITAHRAALTNNVPTIAVLAHGLDHIYPAAHKNEAALMMENGALLTEYRVGTPMERKQFVSRNRLIAALTDATLVVESSENGGSMLTMRYAASYSREIMVVPGSPLSESFRGCNWAIKTGFAKMVENADDVAAVMNWENDNEIEKRDNIIEMEQREPLGESEQLLWDVLQTEKDGLTASMLSAKMQMPVRNVNAILFDLEMKERVKAMPGNNYKAI
ncbi:MAG: DNA-processing protein DprA [Bacteroidales bacterium]|nr:DNA-processing protein DprA [Bacteroidales bacterium]